MTGRLVLTLVAVAATIALFELGLRVSEPDPLDVGLRRLHEVRSDRPWLYGLRPGASAEHAPGSDVSYRINADGFRDVRHARPAPPGAQRVAVVGDSLTFGYGVGASEVYTHQLQQLADVAAPGAGLAFLNLGVGGYNPYNEAALLADVGMAYGPQLVLVQFCINDLNDPTLHFDASTQLVLGDIPDEAFPNAAARRPVTAIEGAAPACGGLRLCRRIVELLAPTTPDPDLLRATFAPRDRPGDTVEWQWLDARYREMAATAAEGGARFAVVVFPYEAQVTGAADDSLQRRLLSIGEAGGWETIDLLEAFREGARRDTRLFMDPFHPTAAGHRIAAEALLAELACRGLLPAAAEEICAKSRRGPPTPPQRSGGAGAPSMRRRTASGS